MLPHTYFTHIFKKLNINCDPVTLGNIISDNNSFFYNYTYKINNQYGGAKQINFKYDKYTFIVYQDEDEYNINFSIHNNNNIDNPLICAHIFIPKDERFAYIQNISNYDNCTLEGLPKTKGGSIILQGVLSFIDSISKKYKLKYIQLKDNSYLYCKSIKKNIPLSSLYMLSRGSTWYYKYGFIPFDEKNKQIDIENLVKLKTNQNLVNLINLNCTKIGELFLQIFDTLKFDKNSKKKLIKTIEKYNNMPIKHFIKFIISDFDNSCDIFYHVYENIMKMLNISNLQGITYYKQI